MISHLKNLLPGIYFLLGYGLINYSDRIPGLADFPDQAVWIIGLILLNVFISLKHRLNMEFLIRFSPAKLPHILFGLVLGAIPTAAVLAFWSQMDVYWTFWWKWDFAYLIPFVLKALILELWFRALPLEYASQQWGGYAASMVVSLLALLMLNMDLVASGQPQALSHYLMHFVLCLMYLGYKSFWLSLGAQLSFVVLPSIVYYEGSSQLLVYQPMYILFVTFLAAIASLLVWKKFYL